jgi:uncharacterized repeat protein (TIGR01451 family)
MTKRLGVLLLLLWLAVQGAAAPLAAGRTAAAPEGTVYYVSSSAGDDDNDGLSEATPFTTVGKVNSLDLQAGDTVLFRCGDVWRADPLQITRSGSAGLPITLSSYPAGCADQPVLSGAQPIAGWTPYSGSIYVTDLAAGANAGKFPYGINQLFRDGVRLTLGRWPNLDAGDGGYSTIDGQPAANRFTDNELPAGDWTGAVAHIRGMRWYILNRQVTGDSGQTLTTGANLDCWGGSCVDWGYFLNNHLSTLDQDGEWYYDAAANRAYLYSAAGAPAADQVEGAVILNTDDRSWGGVVLGTDLGDPIAYVVIENLDLRQWFRHGIATPTNHHAYEDHDLVLRNNTVQDVDGIGINLATWVYDAQDGRPDGWRGGYDLAVSGNTISGANAMGINSYARQSTFTANAIRDVGLIANLGVSGMGCSFTAGEGACTEDGDGIRIKVDQADDSGNSNILTGNRLERIAYNGIDVFGHHNTLEHNVIYQPCYAKGDCGGVRTFGSSSLANTPVHDLLFHENIILDAIGNTDGCATTYRSLFGFGLYVDNYSRAVAVDGNTIVSSTVSGILFQNSTGSITGNTLYNNSRGTMYAAQVDLTSAPTWIAEHSGNVLYSISTNGWTLATADSGRLGASDTNYFFNPYWPQHISAQGNRTLSEWQTYSGMDSSSKEAWFSLNPGDPPRSRIFYNDTSQTQVVDLGTTLYLDLDQNVVAGSLTLLPYRSQVLVAWGEVADLALTMTPAGSTGTAPGAPITYTLTIANLGGATAGQPVLTHTVPAAIVATSWQASTGGVVQQPGTRYVWNLPDLAGGATLHLTVTGTFTDTLPPGTTLLLVAEVATLTPEGTTANNRAFLGLGPWQPVYLPLLVNGYAR